MKLKSRLKYRRNLKRIKAQEKALPNNDYWFVSTNNPIQLLFAQSTPSVSERMRTFDIAFGELDIDLAYEAIAELFGGDDDEQF